MKTDNTDELRSLLILLKLKGDATLVKVNSINQ